MNFHSFDNSVKLYLQDYIFNPYKTIVRFKRHWQCRIKSDDQERGVESCFVMQYFVSFLVLQYHLDEEDSEQVALVCLDHTHFSQPLLQNIFLKFE